MNVNANKTKPLMPGANPDAMRADLERRRSGAAGRHDSRPHRQRSRQASRRAAIKEYS